MAEKAKWFWKNAHCDECETQFLMVESWRSDAETVAEKAASYYHDNHDGWEDSWPVDFSVRKDGSAEWLTFSVDREAVPAFTATRKEDSAHAD